MDVIFKSINQGDVVQAAEHGVWQHSKNALKVNVGDAVYVIPTQAAADLVHMHSGDRLVLVGKLKEIKPPAPDTEWVSKGEYNSSTYVLEDCKLMPIGNVDPGVILTNNNTQYSIVYYT